MSWKHSHKPVSTFVLGVIVAVALIASFWVILSYW